MTQELILASHRLPIEVRRTQHGLETRTSPGGLARALDDFLRKHHGTWIGYAGLEGHVELDEEQQAAHPYGMVPIPMDREEVARHYLGFSNQILWPLFHDLHPYCDFEPSSWETYKKINGRYARMIHQTGSDESIIWLHDYHLIMVPGMLRAHGDTRTLGFFLHIPFPPVEILERLPWHQQLLESLTHVDQIGFQTERDLDNFTNAVDLVLDDTRVVTREAHRAYIATPHGGFEARVLPISIDALAIQQQAMSPDVQDRLIHAREGIGHDQTCIVGVERLDYTKGIPERLRAFRQALEQYPELRGKVTLWQHINPSREKIALYSELKQEVERLVGQINGVFGTMAWVPVRYSYGTLDFKDVLTLYRLGSVALVTPLRDGMNLVCKEYCIAKGDEGGALILSQFAGAAEQLGEEALLVNPHDVDQVARAIREACTMSPQERMRRTRALQQRIHDHDVHAWARQFLHAISSSPHAPTLDAQAVET